jgi:hypothetical protein
VPDTVVERLRARAAGDPALFARLVREHVARLERFLARLRPSPRPRRPRYRDPPSLN